MQRSVDVVSLGHAIVDVLARTSDDVVAGFGLTKGTMTLVDDQQGEAIYGALEVEATASGGSAANTAAVLASLGSAAAFVGKVRDDDLGEAFATDIRAAGVDYAGSTDADGPGTGRCVVMVTPDAEKTMCTNLGIGARLDAGDVPVALVEAARVLYLEGYLVSGEPTGRAVSAAVEAARAQGTEVALSLSDPFLVHSAGDALRATLAHTDIVFANEDEATGLTGIVDVEDAARALAKECSTVVVTRGGRGSLAVTDAGLVTVPASPVREVVDTTGAGDSFAAGYLHGHVRGAAPETCLRLGGLVAAEIVSHLGARPLVNLSELAVSAGLAV
jgi:sugar/nucleoside kinase (ribokinase family)